MTHLNNPALNSQVSKISLNATNQFEKSREQLLATSNSNFNMSGTLSNTLKFYTQPQTAATARISPKNQTAPQ